MSKMAHYVTLYKYRINDVIKYTWGIPYKRVDAAAVVAAHLSVRRACVSTADMTLAPILTSCAGNTKPVHRSSDMLARFIVTRMLRLKLTSCCVTAKLTIIAVDKRVLFLNRTCMGIDY